MRSLARVVSTSWLGSVITNRTHMKYKVSGMAFCALEIACEVEANSEAEAIKKAHAYANKNKSGCVVGNSADETHWWNWEPSAEALPNVPVRREPDNLNPNQSK